MRSLNKWLDERREVAVLVLRRFIAFVLIYGTQDNVMVHLRLLFNANIAPMAMLVGGVFFLIYGAPRYSFDGRLARTT